MPLQKFKATKRKNLLNSPNARKAVLSRHPLNEQVAEKLRNMIITGELEEGKKVPVTEISEILGVSPTPLREALKVLAEEKLVELTPNRGARVLPTTVEETTSLFEVIAELESLGAKLAATRITAKELELLEKLHFEMRAFFDVRNRESYFELNNQIHAAIMEFSHNPVLSHMHQKTTVRVARVRFVAVHENRRWEESMQEHEEVMIAFREKNADRAADIWREHLKKSGEVTIEVLKLQQQKEK